ncbi:MAG: hypothetical protein KAS04_04625, partial [Candidatus Aenigmarchaeota archaeon]|nr:hypothetical protein [Candidatus Aenigmarchaeota archaeon]
LSCNYDNKIIQPIKSRLTPFYISGLTPDDMKELIGRVCTKENITIDKDALETLIRMGDKDSRRIINTLQACAMLNKQIEKESVEKILQIPDRNIVKEMMIQATGNDIEKAFGIATNHIINSGFDIKKILIMMSDIILELDIEDFMRVKFIDILSTGEANINNGNTIDIQMKGMISKMNLVSKMNPKCML